MLIIGLEYSFFGIMGYIIYKMINNSPLIRHASFGLLFSGIGITILALIELLFDLIIITVFQYILILFGILYYFYNAKLFNN